MNDLFSVRLIVNVRVTEIGDFGSYGFKDCTSITIHRTVTFFSTSRFTDTKNGRPRCVTKITLPPLAGICPNRG